MATEEDARRSGVGRIIIARLEAIAKERGVRRITLNAGENIVGFFEHLGYRVAGEGPTMFDEIRHSKTEKELINLDQTDRHLVADPSHPAPV